MSTPSRNAIVAQSGGPTAVINQSLVGLIEALRGSGSIERLYGARHAVRGMVNSDLIDLGELSPARLDRLAHTPSAALGSTRDKPNEEYCRLMFETLARREIGYFFYIGGNDSSDTCRIVDEMAARDGYALRCFHIPKTIDNDLVCNDHTPGYGSAARFVATAFICDDLDNAALPGIKINVVMGRHAGFLTAASTLGRRHDDDGPHLVYVPERIFDPEIFVEEVERTFRRLGRCVIAVSEGIRDRAGNSVGAMMSQLGETDAHGNVQLSGTGALGDALAERLRQDLGGGKKPIRVRSDTFGYLQRSHFDASPVDQDEARRVGEHAGMLALRSAESCSITIQRRSSDPYQIEIGTTALANVAAKTRTLDPEFLDPEQPDVTDAFRRYAMPLVGSLPVIERL